MLIDEAEAAELEAASRNIESVMSYLGLREQTMKAQLIYIYYLNGCVDDYLAYANCFQTNDDSMLLASLNEAYGKEIGYEDFMQSYKMALGVTIDPFLFRNTGTKNAADLAAWCRNAYDAGWLWQPGGYGEMDTALRCRTADNLGLILGYFNYAPEDRAFGNSVNTLVYTEYGGIETMPDIAGLGVFTGSEFGIYGGNGQVYIASGDGQCVQQIPIGDGRWRSWCTFEGIGYPQAVWDAIAALQTPPEEESEGEEA